MSASILPINDDFEQDAVDMYVVDSTTDFTEWSDEDLMVACANDSEPAFRELVDRFGPRVVNFITRWTGNRDRAEDLSQEVFVRVYVHRRRYKRMAKFSTWLYTIAMNLVRNDHRRLKTRGHQVTVDPVTGMNESGTLHLEDQGMGPDESARREELGRVVRDAIMDLPAIHREILILRDLQELKYAEVGELLGIPGGTVRSRLNRARLALKEKLVGLLPPAELDQLVAG